MELWDAYDENMQLIPDKVLIRGEEIQEGLYHIVCAVLLKHVDGDILLMQRDYNKPILPGKWEATACGSCLKGETALECIERELFEETGIRANFFTRIGIKKRKDSFFVQYVTTVDCPKNSVRLQDKETINYRWVNSKEYEEIKNSLANYFTLAYFDELK